jgi:hypothetical protein
MREPGREFGFELGPELAREDGFDFDLLEVVLPLSKARLRKSSCMLDVRLFRKGYTWREYRWPR